MRLETLEQFLQRGKPAVVGHFQFHRAFGDPRQQRFLHLRLFLLHFQAALLRVHILGQGGEQQNAQGSLIERTWRFALRRQSPRQREGGILPDKSMRGMKESLPRQGLYVRRAALDDDGQDRRACRFNCRIEIIIYLEHAPQRAAHGLQVFVFDHNISGRVQIRQLAGHSP